MKLSLLIIMLNVSFFATAQDTKRDRIKELLVLTHQDTFSIRKFEELSQSSSINYSEYLNDSTTLDVFSTYIKDTSLLNDMKMAMKDTAYLSLIGAINDISSSKQKIDKEKIKKMAMQFVQGELVDIYDQTFSRDEIEELIAFYKTSAGRKVVFKTPGIQEDIKRRIERKYSTYLQGL